MLCILHPICIPPSERADIFTYLSSLVTGDNNVSEEITNRPLVPTNRSYFGLKCLLKPQLISWKTKILIYAILVMPLLTHAAATWTTTNKDKRRLSISERQILRRMYVGRDTMEN